MALIMLFLVLVTQSILTHVFDNHILQFLSMLENNSWLVQGLLVGLICLIYAYLCVKSSSLYNGSEIIPSRIIWISTVLIIYLYFRLTYQADYICYGLKCVGIIGYTDICTILVILIELTLGILRRKNNNMIKSTNNQSIKVQSFVPDVPTAKDHMNRDGHVQGLLNKIIVSYNNKVVENNCFTILLNEKYGAGKTTFMLNLKEQIKSDEAYVIDFKPWLCPDSQQMATELINQFVENKIPIKERQLIKYAQALANEGSWIGIASRFVLNSTSKSLSKQFEEIAKDMQSLKKPVVVLVDDVDRLSDDELIELLKLIRNTAAFPNVFYIVAADKGYLCTALANKGIKEPDLFLQKFFNFEITFPKDDFYLEDILKSELYNIIDDKDSVQRFITTEAVRYMLKTPRDVHRYCNMLSYELDLLKHKNVASEIYLRDLMNLTLLQYYTDIVYKLLRDNDESILVINHGNISLNENFRDAVIANNKILTELAAKYTAQPIPKEKCTRLDDAINKSISSKEKIILDLLYDLFPDSPNYNMYSISKEGEYFKYFSGRNARYEVMGAQVQRIINLPTHEFRGEFNKICLDNKFDNFHDKLLRCLRNQNVDNICVFKNIVHIWQYIKSLPQNKDLENDDIFNLDMLNIVFECFNLKDELNEQPNIDTIKLQVEEWINTEDDLEFLALILSHIRTTPHSGLRMLWLNKEVQDYSNVVISRFIEEKMSKDSFADEIVKQYYSFGLLHWYPQLKEYIHSLTEEQRKEWIYRVVKTVNGKLVWNFKLIKGIGAQHGHFLHTYFEELGIKFDEKLQSALDKVNLHSPVEEQLKNDFVKYILSLHE